MKQLTEQELTTLTTLNTDFAKAKMALGDLEIQQSMILHDISTLKQKFDEQEKVLGDKYGADAIINLKTGEITYDKDGEN